MNVFIERTNENCDVAFEGTVAGLLGLLRINPETVLVSRNAELLVETDKVQMKDSIRILSVISGG